MTISGRLYLVAILPVVLTLVLLGGLLLSYVSMAELQREQAAVTRVRTDLNQLNEFARVYLLREDEGSREQFMVQSDLTLRELAAFSADTRYRDSAEGIAEDVRQMQSYFNDIVAVSRRSDPTAEEAEIRLSALFSIRSNQANESAALLVREISEDIVGRQETISMLVAGAAMLTTIALVSVSLALRSGIIRGLRALTVGTERVGGGELGYRIGLTRRDELGALSRSFDAMTDRLRTVTVSKAALEQEIELRRQAEEKLRHEARLSEALNQIDARATSTLEVDEIMSSVVESVAEAIRAEFAVIHVDVDGEFEARYGWQEPDWLRGRRLTADRIPFSAQALAERSVLLFDDPKTHPRWEGSVAQRLGAAQVIDAPLLIGEERVGDLVLYGSHEHRWTQPEVDFVRKVSTSVSLALRNAQLYERERQVADTLQEALLQVPDDVPGIEFAYTYRSASDVARVGGDFYDLFELEKGRLGITVGDVAGKGLEASVLTSLVKNAIQAEALDPRRPVAEVMETVNKLVLKSSPDDAFVTVFFASLDRASGQIVYCNAGHTSGVIVGRSDPATRTLPATSPLVGAFDDLAFVTEETTLGEGELLLLYTDGLTEAWDGQDRFGEWRLLDLLGRLGKQGSRETVDAVLDEVLAYSGGTLNDDLAILAVERLPDE